VFYQTQIEKSKIEQLEKIRQNTQEQLNLLNQKYSTYDKMGTSLAILAYITIGLFIAVILLNDLSKFVAFLIDKRKGKKKIAPRNYIFRKKEFNVDQIEFSREKLNKLDDRIFKLRLEFAKSLNSKKIPN